MIIGTLIKKFPKFVKLTFPKFSKSIKKLTIIKKAYNNSADRRLCCIPMVPN